MARPNKRRRKIPSWRTDFLYEEHLLPRAVNRGGCYGALGLDRQIGQIDNGVTVDFVGAKRTGPDGRVLLILVYGGGECLRKIERFRTGLVGAATITGGTGARGAPSSASRKEAAETAAGSTQWRMSPFGRENSPVAPFDVDSWNHKIVQA